MGVKTEIHFVNGEILAVDEDETRVKMTEHGIEILEHEGDDEIKILFPWTRIDKVQQRGPSIGAIYHY